MPSAQASLHDLCPARRCLLWRHVHYSLIIASLPQSRGWWVYTLLESSLLQDRAWVQLLQQSTKTLRVYSPAQCLQVVPPSYNLIWCTREHNTCLL